MKTTSFQCPIHKLKDLKIENPFHISGYISTWASLTIITSFSKKFKIFKKTINLYYMDQLNNNYIIFKNVEIFKFLKNIYIPKEKEIDENFGNILFVEMES